MENIKIKNKSILASSDKKYCGICQHYCDWFGDCFAEEDGAGNPMQNGFHGDNFGNRSGICRLFKPRNWSNNK